ncbi:hypothetical protein HAX54_004344, partial [Datura stramonium]|nr:hypothetical protein [Datura stramonium]
CDLVEGPGQGTVVDPYNSSAYHNRQSRLQASSSATDELDRLIMFAIEEKIAHLSSQTVVTTKRKRLGDELLAATTERERPREKQYAGLQ